MNIHQLTDEQQLLARTVSEFAATELEPVAKKLDESQEFNAPAFRKMADLGLLGITAGDKYGGSGLGCLEATLAMESLGEACGSTTLSYLAHSILCVNNIWVNGNDDQRARYLPDLISGKHIGGMGMTEPGYGSDALGMQTKAVKKGDKYVLNGTKTYITNGPVGDVFVVYARTGEGRKDISTFIVEKGFSGFRTGNKMSKLGMRASPTGELFFDNCEVPEANRMGEENSSVSHMLNGLNIERITISGLSIGLAKASLKYAVGYASEREQFGKPISEYQMIQERLAEMSANLEAARAIAYATARAYDDGDRDPVLGAHTKLFAAQMATKAGLDAIQILGGYGYTKEYPVERYMRDAKLMEIGAGTNEVMRLVIAKGLLNLHGK